MVPVAMLTNVGGMDGAVVAAPNDDIDDDNPFDVVMVEAVDVELEKFDRAAVSVYGARVTVDISVFELDEDIASNHLQRFEKGVTCYKETWMNSDLVGKFPSYSTRFSAGT